MAAVLSTGTTITFATSGFSAEIIDTIQPFSASRGSVQTSHFGTTSAHTFIPTKLKDCGELTFTIHYDPENHSVQPIDLLDETSNDAILITYPDSNTEGFSGFCTNVTPSVPFEDKMTCDITFKITGDAVTTDVA